MMCSFPYTFFNQLNFFLRYLPVTPFVRPTTSLAAYLGGITIRRRSNSPTAKPVELCPTGRLDLLKEKTDSLSGRIYIFMKFETEGYNGIPLSAMRI
jgi:hypothetical protein